MSLEETFLQGTTTKKLKETAKLIEFKSPKSVSLCLVNLSLYVGLVEGHSLCVNEACLALI